MEKLTIIGAGIGDISYLTEEAMYFISKHKNIYTAEERFENLKEINNRIKIIPYSKLEKTIEESKKDIAIIVSGDYGFYSIAKTMIRIFSDKKEINLINGISSMQYFASKLNKVYQDWAHLSLHGTNKDKLLGSVSYNEKVFILTGGKNKVEDICKTLLEAGFENLKVYVGENLGYIEEKVIEGSLEEISKLEFEELTVMLVENPYFVSPTKVLKDTDFVTSGVHSTKEIIRWTVINKLEINPTDIIYNIGAGAGDCAVEISRKASLGIVYSFEKEDKALEIMVKNKKKHGAYNILNIKTFVPNFDEEFYEEMNFLPPDKVLITGSGNQLEEIFDWILQLNPYCKIVVTSSTLEGLTEAINCYQQFNISPEINCINISNVEKIEKGNILLAQNPVYILSGEIEELEDEK